MTVTLIYYQFPILVFALYKPSTISIFAFVWDPHLRQSIKQTICFVWNAQHFRKQI